MVDDWDKNEEVGEDFTGKKKGARSFADEEPDLTAEDEEDDEDLYDDGPDGGDEDE